jgi:Tol biopolymer transport system component
MSLFKQALAALGVAAAAVFSPGVLGDTHQVPPALESSERVLLSNVRQLIFEGRRSGEGYFSADGTRMIFQSEREPGNPFYQMYLLDLETGDTRRLSPGIGKTTCGWIHPSGEKVLFASSHQDPNARAKQKEELDKRSAGTANRYSWSFDEHYDIFESDTSGQHLNNLTNAIGYDAEASWSPDGQLIAFASNRHAYAGTLSSEEQKTLAQDKSYFMDVYSMHADGTYVRRLTEAPGYDGGPFFSPDGKRIVWRQFSEDGAKAEIWTMNIDGSDKQQITHLGVMSWAPYFHPTGEYIIFATNKHGFANFELYLVDPSGRSEPVRVTNTEGFDGLPVFAPDGNSLAWTSSRTGDRKAQLFMATWNHTEARRLLGLEGAQPAHAKAQSEIATEPPSLTATSAAIRPEDVRLHLTYLASEALGGRLTGSPGERLATDYVAGVFRQLGLEPAGDADAYFQSYEFTAGVTLGSDNRASLQLANKLHELKVDADWRPLAFSANGAVDFASVAFAGYGIVAPGSEQFPAYDAYQDLDVEDKWLMVFRYLPEDVSPEYRQHLANYASLHYKAMVARDKGARGLIVVSGPKAQANNELVTLSFDRAVATSRLMALSITDALAERLLGGTHKNLRDLQEKLDGGEAVKGVPLLGVRIAAQVDLRREKGASRNVLGRLRAIESMGDSAVIIGAHVDHIGDGLGLDSLAGEGERGKIHPGADDNASGVAGLLEIAQYLADQKAKGRLELKRDLLFAVWTGEELGLLGSGHFVRKLSEGKEQDERLGDRVSAYLNLDMIGRMDKQLYLQGVGSSSVWAREIEQRNAPVGLPIVIQQDSYLPTDATSFYLKGVPVLSGFTGAHADYNTPRDTADKVNYDGVSKIARLTALIARSLALSAATPDYIAMEKPAATASRRNLRAYLGTIPEYGDTDVRGVKLNGVAKGGPAENAGLKGGDIIVEMAGRPIDNIYDYTYVLNAAKVGQPVDISVIRVDQTIAFSVIPGSRD